MNYQKTAKKMETETIDRLFLELSQVTQATTEKEIRLKEQNQMLSKHVVSLTKEREDLLDLLTSARAIAIRHGEDTAWEHFGERLRLAGAGSVTPKTFRVLPNDAENSLDSQNA
jgi:hypothetical protein